MSPLSLSHVLSKLFSFSKLLTQEFASFRVIIFINLYFSDDINVTVAYSKSLARPDYYDLVPYQYSNSDDDEVEFGNSDLEATVADNYDIIFEKYFGSTGQYHMVHFTNQLTIGFIRTLQTVTPITMITTMSSHRKETVKARAYMEQKLLCRQNW